MSLSDSRKNIDLSTQGINIVHERYIAFLNPKVKAEKLVIEKQNYDVILNNKKIEGVVTLAVATPSKR